MKPQNLITPELLEASNYREFAKIWIRGKQEAQRFGFADIARHGGFSARSFPRDVLNGTKRLTLTSLTKFIQGLRLPTDLAEYFRTLVEIEHKDCRTKIQDSVKLDELKTRLKTRISARLGDSVLDKDAGYKVFHLPEVYAALGSVEAGATIDEIINRTELPAHEIESSLQQLLSSGIASRKRARFFAKQPHLNIEGLKQSEVFKKHFIWSSERSAKMVKGGLDSDSKLFLSSAFSVNQSDLPKLKEELRQVLLKFVDAAETSDGNKVVNMVASLF